MTIPDFPATPNLRSLFREASSSKGADRSLDAVSVNCASKPANRGARRNLPKSAGGKKAPENKLRLWASVLKSCQTARE